MTQLSPHGAMRDPIQELADEVEAATGVRPTTLLCRFPLDDDLLEEIAASASLRLKRVDRGSGIIEFGVIPP